MNAGWLLKSSTLWWALGISGASSCAILVVSPDGIMSLSRRESELAAYRQNLAVKVQRNRELTEEVKRLAAKDPELFEALARRQGFAKPGETVYTFRERKN
ncbi:MAG: Septum formation initiator [Holophagaceae bacterium]|nr:Septum formation initiator [Holophagaceae bacterium]